MGAAPHLTFGPMAVHIGAEILRRLEESHMPKTKFADLIGRNRTSMYDIFEAPTCDTGLLRKVSQVLKFNFFRLLADDFDPPAPPDSITAEPVVRYQQSPPKPHPMRIVIELDPHDAGARAEAEKIARSLSAPHPAPAPQQPAKRPRKKQVHPPRRKR